MAMSTYSKKVVRSYVGKVLGEYVAKINVYEPGPMPPELEETKLIAAKEVDPYDIDDVGLDLVEIYEELGIGKEEEETESGR